MRKTSGLLLFALLIVGLSASINAGVKLKMESKSTNIESSQTGWLYIGDENRLRIDSEIDSETGEPYNSVIFRGDLNALFMVDHEEEVYLKMDHDKIRELSARLEEAMKQMQDQLETLPDAQRKIMEDMMSKNIPQSQEELLVEVKDKGQDGDYWKYEIWIGIDKRSEIWVAEPSKMGVSEESFQVFKNMSAFYDDLLTALRNNPMLESIGRNPFSGLAEMKGFPVKVHHLKENQVTSISAGERVDFEDGFFSPPPGYTESRPDSH